MKKTIKFFVPVCLLIIAIYAYSVIPVRAIEQEKPKPTDSILFNKSTKKKNSGSDEPPPLTGLPRSGDSGENSAANWPWPGYHKDGYKIDYDDPVEEEIECTAEARTKLKDINKGIEKFLEVGQELKGETGDIKNKRDLRKIVKKVNENQDSLIGLNLAEHAKYYKACGMEVPDTGLYQMQIIIEGANN